MTECDQSPALMSVHFTVASREPGRPMSQVSMCWCEVPIVVRSASDSREAASGEFATTR
jgi:hypothetical protein